MACRKFTEASRVDFNIGACGATGPVSFIAHVKLDGTKVHIKEEVPIEEEIGPEEFEIIGYETVEYDLYPGLEVGSMISAVSSLKAGQGKFYDFQVEGGKLEIYKEGASREIEAKPYGDIWAVFGATKAEGTVKAKLYAYRPDTKVLVGPVEGANAIGNAAANAAGYIRHGQWGNGEQLRALVAGKAVWKKELTPAEMEEAMKVAYLEQWLTKSPSGLWLYNQTSLTEKVQDLTGNGANEVERVGTELSAEKPLIPYTAAEAEASGGVADSRMLLGLGS